MSYLVSLLLCFGVGVTYALLTVTPPAPPVIALVGPLGMLAGDTAATWVLARWATRNRVGATSAVHTFEPAVEGRVAAPGRTE